MQPELLLHIWLRSVTFCRYGFIVMDGNGSLFGTLSGNSREILGKFSVDLPKKHGRGGQSALRFARLRMEKRHNYVRKVAETAVQFFISVDKVNVAGIVLAGSADFKTELSQSDMFDGRLQAAILAVVDVSYGESQTVVLLLHMLMWHSLHTLSRFTVTSTCMHWWGCSHARIATAKTSSIRRRFGILLRVSKTCAGGENGFNQAIELSADTLANVKFVQEKRLISKFFDEISQDTSKYVFGVADTLQCLEMGAVETLVVWEDLQVYRYTLMNSTSGKFLSKLPCILSAFSNASVSLRTLAAFECVQNLFISSISVAG